MVEKLHKIYGRLVTEEIDIKGNRTGRYGIYKPEGVNANGEVTYHKVGRLYSRVKDLYHCMMNHNNGEVFIIDSRVLWDLWGYVEKVEKQREKRKQHN